MKGTVMKRNLEKLQVHHAQKRNPRLHARGSSALARLRIPLLALVCAAVAGTCTAIANTPPTAENLFIATVVNVPTSIVLKGADVDGDPLTFSLASSPVHGFLSGTSPNLTYTPQTGFAGLDGFTYVVNDGQATSVPATVTINVRYGLSINNISVTEGNTGTTPPTIATFTVSKTGSATCGDPVTFNLRFADGTAKAGSDYQSFIYVSIPIPPNQTSVSITVPVIGDRSQEFNESFLAQLSNPSINAVIVNGTGRCTILNDDAGIILSRDTGTAALSPENSVVGVGEPVNLSLTWTHPVGWRHLTSVDLLLVDEEGSLLTVRWNPADNSFSLLNSAADRSVRTVEAGSPTRFETSGATSHLQETTGGGPPGQTATIDFSLSFKSQAAGRTFSVEAFATDDAGHQQGFESVGTITVLPR
jgi:hypothetical protein